MLRQQHPPRRRVLAVSESDGWIDAKKLTVLPNEGGIDGNPQDGTGEGLAILEIINKIAPGAQLYFATGEGGAANMADNILQLSATGCKIIVDDILYNDESPFQDGPIAQAVDQVVKDGGFYFSATGNNGSF